MKYFSTVIQNHSIEKLRLVAYGKFSKTVTSWIDKVLYI